MEKRTFTNILVTLAILALIPIGFGVYTYLTNQYIDWNETYEVDNKEPYNNYMVFNLLKNYKTDKEFIFIDNLLTERLAEEEIKNAKEPISYVFVGDKAWMLDDEVAPLLDFVAKGNTAFFAVNNLPDTLLNLLDFSSNEDNYKDNYKNNYGYNTPRAYGLQSVYDSLISTNFEPSILKTEPNLTFNYRKRNESTGKFWYYFHENDLKEVESKKKGTQIEKLGYLYKETELSKYNHNNYQEQYNEEQYNNENYDEENYNNENYNDENYNNEDYTSEGYTESYPENGDDESVIVEEKQKYTNFIRVKHGKGYFYFHKNPVLFTNYYVIQEDGKKYVERALSYLPEGDILWDERSHFYKRSTTTKKGEYGGRKISPSPLSYILSQPALAWGYYTLLVSALLFIVFRGKRMQRIIPILRKEQNTSLEFTKTVGQLYYLQQDHKRLSQLKIRLFFDFIRTKYHMNTQHIDDDFRKKLSERSTISRELIDLLLSDIQKVNGQHEVSEWLLRKIHTQIQEFYTNCK